MKKEFLNKLYFLSLGCGSSRERFSIELIIIDKKERESKKKSERVQVQIKEKFVVRTKEDENF